LWLYCGDFSLFSRQIGSWLTLLFSLFGAFLGTLALALGYLKRLRRVGIRLGALRFEAWRLVAQIRFGACQSTSLAPAYQIMADNRIGKRLFVKLDEEITPAIREIAKADRRSVASLVNMILREFLRPPAKKS
jgi:hypothetical protein